MIAASLLMLNVNKAFFSFLQKKKTTTSIDNVKRMRVAIVIMSQYKNQRKKLYKKRRIELSVCVCVCGREGGREGEREREKIRII